MNSIAPPRLARPDEITSLFVADDGAHTNCSRLCAPSAVGCARCEAFPAGRRSESLAPQPTLFLVAQDAESAAALRSALAAGNIVYSESRSGESLSVVRIAVRYRLAALGVALKAHLPAACHDRICAAYAPDDADLPGTSLAAFGFGVPLTKLLGQIEYAWVREALAEDRLFSVFQPIVDLGSGAVMGQEALLRGIDRSGATIGAGPIIEACTTLKLHHQLDQRARLTAIRCGSVHVPASERLFVNFLPNTIYDPEICLRTTLAIARECNVSLTRLVFEVVETEHIPDMRHLRNVLDYYRANGIGTAIDDIGAGFASAEYIAALRPDYVKLDRELVGRATQSQIELRALQDIVDQAHQIGAQVIAEGIETPEQLALCLDVRADYGQGFLFARPACPPQPVQFSLSTLQRAHVFATDD